jgi:hypothetical protein
MRAYLSGYDGTPAGASIGGRAFDQVADPKSVAIGFKRPGGVPKSDTSMYVAMYVATTQLKSLGCALAALTRLAGGPPAITHQPS